MCTAVARCAALRGDPAKSGKDITQRLGYLLLAPWPHDYLHRITHINGVFNWTALAGIEYVFHFGIVPVGVLVGTYLLRAREVRRAV